MQTDPKSDKADANEPIAAPASLLDLYTAIERASTDMLAAARSGDWNRVVMIEGACVLLINRLRAASRVTQLEPDERVHKQRIMERILVNDAQIRQLAEPWLDDLDRALHGKRATLH
jgi:flagellar protein FliT